MLCSASELALMGSHTFKKKKKGFLALLLVIMAATTAWRFYNYRQSLIPMGPFAQPAGKEDFFRRAENTGYIQQ